MKRRRKNKGGRSFYMVLSILCLTALFLGYSFVYNLSEERKSHKEITTISINYNADSVNKESGTLDKIMSYFNMFLEKTFKEKDKDEEVFKIIDTQSKNEEVFQTIASKDVKDGKEELEIFNQDDYKTDNKDQVYVASDRKDSFFKVIQTTSRSSSPRRLFLNAASLADSLNVVFFHTHGTEAFQSTNDTNYRTLDESLNKDQLVYRIMIRQPEQVTESIVSEAIEQTLKKKDNPYINQLKFETYTDGGSIQMVHTGSFDTEAQSFRQMDVFLETTEYERDWLMGDFVHREIYLSDARRVVPEKRKTLLRYKLKKKN